MVGPQRADGNERPPPPQQPLNCPRCDSLNTKFCYYNNYSLSQPRHFCKACRRYWTQGGTLRNVPVGGGCRKKSRSKPATATAAVAAATGSSSSSSADTSHFSRHHHHVVQSSGPTTSPAVPPPPDVGSVFPIHYHSGVGLLSSLTALQSSLGYQQDPLGGPPLINRQSIGTGNPSGPNIGFLQGLGQVNPMLASLNNQSQQAQPTPSFLRDVYPSPASNASEATEWGIGGPSSGASTGGPTVNLNGHPYGHLPGYGHPPRNY
ncbi:hypothetical protein MLD38_039896 [Melastoma candidum]|uniref:Uncharacterized protein n=1 Tax=Melastoma candidum TaxID=119954 RepID=A0ACB9L3H6_9MYRT|nr:hypothetical protein MLD38_039896 [Melastoma candidum]